MYSSVERRHWNNEEEAPFTADFKKRVALEALRERDPVQVIAARARLWRTLFHGRPQAPSRQHLHRTAMAFAEVRGDLPSRDRGGRDAERVVGSWFRSYGESRPHSSPGNRTPGDIHPGGLREAA